MKARLLLLALVLAAAAESATAAVARARCVGPTEHWMAWPTADPVWDFCWVRPSQSSATNGSGIEIREAFYKGHLVLKRGHVPILNVQYDVGSCGGANHCYRDWLTSEQPFLVDNPCPPPLTAGCGYAEPSCPPITVCEQHLGVDVCPATDVDPCNRVCFQGVAFEKLADRLILTTQAMAGWYRYEMKWTFFLDGRIQPTMGYSAVANACVANTHRHHAYWRLDFDIDGPDGDVVTEGPDGVGKGIIDTEAMRLNDDPALWWSIVDSRTGRGYRLVPGTESELPADNFSVGDVWLLKYKAQELDDVGQPGPACAVKLSGYLNGESLAVDTVLWYRTGALHLGGDLGDCHTVGPTFEPIGNW